MPYQYIEDLPDSVKEHLPRHAQAIFLAAFNNALEVDINDWCRALVIG